MCASHAYNGARFLHAAAPLWLTTEPSLLVSLTELSSSRIRCVEAEVREEAAGSSCNRRRRYSAGPETSKSLKPCGHSADKHHLVDRGIYGLDNDSLSSGGHGCVREGTLWLDHGLSFVAPPVRLSRWPERGRAECCLSASSLSLQDTIHSLRSVSFGILLWLVKRAVRRSHCTRAPDQAGPRHQVK